MRSPDRHRAPTLLLLLVVACVQATASDDPDPQASGGTAHGDEASGSEAATPDAGDPLGPDDGAVTFYRDVLPVMQARCTACHRDGNIAPFSLERYEDAWPWREAIAAAVTAGTMPPWLPDSSCAEYSHDPTLPPTEIDTLVAWAAEQGPRGNPDDAPAAVDHGDDGLPRVDVELSSPLAYTPVGADDYRCFLLDWPLDTPSFVTGFHVRPGNPSLVHHVIAYRIAPDRVPEYEALDAADPSAGYPCFGGPGGAVTDPGAGLWLGAWAPGGHATPYPEGTGLAIEPDAKVVLQIHYNTAASDGDSDRTSIELMTADTVEREAFMLLWADLDWLAGNMPIPAGDADVVHSWALDPTVVMDFLTDVIPPNAPFLIHSSAHHMHLLGRSARHRILHPDGGETCLLDIPRWDFAWQSAYGFATPQRFEPGDTLELTCHWDNGAGDEEVNWGEGTRDEMCLGIYYVTGV
ncbi:MAG: monooxygenase [Deltaproteobacteria bacterium]|nr:monooxygenase [Deltaproteobacteria bacterium]